MLSRRGACLHAACLPGVRRSLSLHARLAPALPSRRPASRLATPCIPACTCIRICCAPQMLVRVMPMGLFRAYSAVIRGANNIVGGMSFVTIARLFGVQKSAAASAQPLLDS